VTGITEQIGRLQARIEAAKQVARREGDNIRILAVSKKHSVNSITQACEAGLGDFGENYLQEALDKIDQVAAQARWHFIGRIQSNKTRLIAEHFDWVQTVTNARIARRLSDQRPREAGELQVCIQIRPTGSAEREGISETELNFLADEIRQLPGLKFRGLMIVPLPGLEPAAIRAEYARTRELLENLQRRGHDSDTLSMGMSDDLEAAIIEGSTMVRIGTALFGRRPA
jgi:pyridoxal phosphate enzyme (YggS family)